MRTQLYRSTTWCKRRSTAALFARWRQTWHDEFTHQWRHRGCCWQSRRCKVFTSQQQQRSKIYTACDVSHVTRWWIIQPIIRTILVDVHNNTTQYQSRSQSVTQAMIIYPYSHIWHRLSKSSNICFDILHWHQLPALIYVRLRRRISRSLADPA